MNGDYTHNSSDEVTKVYEKPYRYGSMFNISTYNGFMKGDTKFSLIITEGFVPHTKIKDSIFNKWHEMTKEVNGLLLLYVGTFGTKTNNLLRLLILFNLIGIAEYYKDTDTIMYVFSPK